MIEKDPLLTIAIPTFNRSTFLKECLDHVISQLEEDIEVIVYDNASSDFTEHLMNDYLERYPFIQYIRNERNIGPDGNFYKCLKSGKGEYIHLLSDDDILLDGSIKTIKKIIKKYDDFSFAFLNSTVFDGEFDLSKCNNKLFKCDKDILFENKDMLIEYLGIYSTFVSGMIFNKKLFDRIENPEKYLDTYLFQSHILFNILALKERAVFISDCCIAARGGNGGGYNFYKVFSHNWKKVLFETGIEKGYNRKVLEGIYIHTIKNFLRNWTILMKTQDSKYDESGYITLINDTYKYPSAWIYLYPFVIIPKSWLKQLKKIFSKIRAYINEM